MNRRLKFFLGLGGMLAVVLVVVVLTGFGGGDGGGVLAPAPSESEANTTAAPPPSEREVTAGTSASTATATAMNGPPPAKVKGSYSDAQFRAALREAGVPVDEVALQTSQEPPAPAFLTYVTNTTSQAALRNETASVAAVYARAAESGYDRERLYVDVYGPAGEDTLAEYEIDRQWALAYAQGRISAEEYGRRIRGTFAGNSAGAPPSPESATEAVPTSASTPEPTPTVITTATATPTREPSTGYTDAEFVQALKDAGIAVSNSQFEQAAQDQGSLSGPLILEYTTDSEDAAGRREEIGTVADVYAQAVEEGYKRKRIEASVFSESGSVAEFRIKRSWAVAYTQGEISAEEYGQRIGQTYRSFRTPESGSESASTASSDRTEHRDRS